VLAGTAEEGYIVEKCVGKLLIDARREISSIHLT
jgi:hypothetical protein